MYLSMHIATHFCSEESEINLNLDLVRTMQSWQSIEKLASFHDWEIIILYELKGGTNLIQFPAELHIF